MCMSTYPFRDLKAFIYIYVYQTRIEIIADRYTYNRRIVSGLRM